MTPEAIVQLLRLRTFNLSFQDLVKAVVTAYPDDPSKAGILTSFVDHKWYMSVCRFKEAYGNGRQVVAKATNQDHDICLSELAAAWFATLSDSKIKKRKVWRTRTGKEIPYSDLENGHLLNILKLLKRKAISIMNTIPSSSYMEDYPWCFDEDWLDFVDDEFYQLVREAKKRGLNTEDFE